MTNTSWPVRALHLIGLAAFALAQPLFQVLGEGPAFFTAHEMGRLEILAFAGIVLLAPPLLILLVIRAVGQVSERAAQVATSVAVGGLGALIVAPAVDRAASLSLAAFFGLAVMSGIAVGALYHRSELATTYTTFLAPAPIAFAVMFLFFSPLRAMIVEAEPGAVQAAGTAELNVIVAVFDELPVGVLLDAEGAIDQDRFPGFAALADISTWYPSTTTATPKTIHAVPSLLTGRYPEEEIESEVAPVAAQYPRSLFTLLGDSHRLRATEWVTQLCPAALCEQRPSDSRSVTVPSSVATDAAILLQHILLPQAYVDQHLPPIGDKWAHFGSPGEEETGPAATAPDLGGGATVPKARNEEGRWMAGQFQELLGDLEGSVSPTVWFAHERLPHRPMEFLPDGRRYERELRFDWYGNRNDFGNISYRQQYLLQVQHVDRMILDFVQNLRQESMLDDTMVVVTSDHGLNWHTEGHPRARDTEDPDILSDVVFVPLFVHYPGQTSGTVDRREAQLVDVLPTVVDVLRVSVPDEWAFDGRSLTEPAGPEREFFWHPMGTSYSSSSRLDPLGLARRNDDLFGSSGGEHDVYAMGPARELIGQVAEGEARSAGTWSPLDPDAFDDVSLDSATLPALFEGEIVVGLQPGTWVVASLNGRLAGTGPIFQDPDDGERLLFAIMLDPALFRAGSNSVELYVLEDREGETVLGLLERS